MCRKFRLAHFLIVLLLLGSSFAHAQDAKSQIATEIARLQDSLQRDPVTDPDLAPVAASASTALYSIFMTRSKRNSGPPEIALP